MTSESTPSAGTVPSSSNSFTDDSVLVARIEAELLKSAKGSERFKQQIPLLLRKAIDEVIDAPRTGRFTIDEIEKTEKTYLGTKVEIFLRSWLRLPKGKILDLSINGIEADIKNTMGSNWMIPAEALGHPCILVKTDEKLSRFSIGILVIRSEHLCAGKNRDGKQSISANGRKRIHWLMKDEVYPENIWTGFTSELRQGITSRPPGTKRVDALFRFVQGKPISRAHVLAVAPQKDAMKRLRKNGGARDSLAEDGIALLSGNYDKDLIAKLKLPLCKKDEFISYQPTGEVEKSELRSLGRIR
jgi:hypothetical protein